MARLEGGGSFVTVEPGAFSMELVRHGRLHGRRVFAAAQGKIVGRPVRMPGGRPDKYPATCAIMGRCLGV